MGMLKETEIIKPLYIARIENGTIIFVYDGYAEGDDGRRYRPVLGEDEYGECELLGWEACEK